LNVWLALADHRLVLGLEGEDVLRHRLPGGAKRLVPKTGLASCRGVERRQSRTYGS
jgi:hypothetical protein